MSIQTLRTKIDSTDRQLVVILSKRLNLVAEIGKLKKQTNLAPLDPARWQHILTTRSGWGSELGLNQNFIQDIFNRIHEYSLQIEKETKI